MPLSLFNTNIGLSLLPRRFRVFRMQTVVMTEKAYMQHLWRQRSFWIAFWKTALDMQRLPHLRFHLGTTNIPRLAGCPIIPSRRIPGLRDLSILRSKIFTQPESLIVGCMLPWQVKGRKFLSSLRSITRLLCMNFVRHARNRLKSSVSTNFPVVGTVWQWNTIHRLLPFFMRHALKLVDANGW